MKILQILPDFCVAGAETMAENLMYELQNMGNEVVAVSLYSKETAITERLKKHGIRIEFLDKKPRLDLSQIFKIYRLLKKETPDVIHTHRYVLQYVGPAVIMAGKTRIIHTVHNIAARESKSTRIANKVFFKIANIIPVSLTEEIQTTVMKEYKVKEVKTPVIYNGMPINEFSKKEDYSFDSEIKILHVGRFFPQKNHKRLIDAFEIVCKKYLASKLFLAGTGELMEEAKALVKEKGLEEKVEFLGLCTDIKKLMSEADIFCLPSDYEGMPITLIEAMASALPIVATNVGGVSDMIENEEEGLLCECDVQAVASAIVNLIENKELRKNCGQAALLKAEKFSAKSMAEKYFDLYKNV